jgi:amino acid adenylation domain-containing protein
LPPKAGEAEREVDVSDLLKHGFELPPEQQAIQAKCFHPSGEFVEFPKEDIEKSIPERFEKIVQKYPDRIAVKTRNRQLTYLELNRAANRLAQAVLACCGAAPEPVALLLPKGTSLVVAILGVLKSGKIFVLLDPTHPDARLRYVLDDSQVSLVVTCQEFLGMAKALSRQKPLLEIETLGTDCAESPERLLRPDDLAYIVYTSGTTGLPKGIVENHRNLLHYIMAETNDLHICAEDRLTFLASQGRDIFRAVLTGAAVYPVEIKHEGFGGLARLLIDEQITIYNSVATAFRDFVNTTLDGVEQFPHLRLIKLMGETVYRSDVELFRKHFSERCIFVNWYGPNEAGLLSHHLVDKASRITSSVVPVGHAVTDKEILILDDDGNDVGVQQAGEIAVRSRYMSPGYWRRLDLTRAVFMSVSSDGTERLYRTGDIGSMGPDGCLMYLGRKDSQVKIRGNRVEIAEVEMALMELETVKEAAVVAREDAPGHKRLVAYIVSARAFAPTVSALRAALAAKLPEYMIPSAFVFLDHMPVIGIGKVDRNSLPLPDSRRPKLDVPYAPPTTSLEEELARIWSEVLSLDHVGIHDNFFDLGGHSLAATRVVSQVIKQFQLELPLQSLFQSPTVAEMAKVIDATQGRTTSKEEIERMLSAVEVMSEEEAARCVADAAARSTTPALKV